MRLSAARSKCTEVCRTFVRSYFFYSSPACVPERMRQHFSRWALICSGAAIAQCLAGARSSCGNMSATVSIRSACANVGSHYRQHAGAGLEEFAARLRRFAHGKSRRAIKILVMGNSVARWNKFLASQVSAACCTAHSRHSISKSTRATSRAALGLPTSCTAAVASGKTRASFSYTLRSSISHGRPAVAAHGIIPQAVGSGHQAAHSAQLEVLTSAARLRAKLRRVSGFGATSTTSDAADDRGWLPVA